MANDHAYNPHNGPEINFHIRPASITDACGIASIQNHYVRATIKTIHEVEYSISAVTERIQVALDEKFPVLVAVSAAIDADSPILGYISTSRFRPQAGWSPTLEVSLFLEPGNRGKGIGSALLAVLIKNLRDARVRSSLPDDQREDSFVQIRNEVRDIRQLIAVCVVDEDNLERFYAKFGFRRIAHFKESGYKFKRWIDIVMLQLMI